MFSANRKMLLLNILLGIFFMWACLAEEDFLSKFSQHDYKIKDKRIECVKQNYEYVKFFHAITFKYNRTSIVSNISFAHKIDMKDKQDIVVQVYKFYSNEYRTFPIRFRINLFKAYQANIIGLQEMDKCGFMNKFYFLKNINYSACNFDIDERKYPPLIPSGRYQVEATFMYGNEAIGTLLFYGEVYRDIPMPKE